MTDKDMDLIREILVQAIHNAQVCPHGVGSDPNPIPKGYFRKDTEWADLIFEEYQRICEAAEEAAIKDAVQELVKQGLLEEVPA